MTIWCKCLMSLMTSFLNILSRLISLIDCSWMAPLTPVVIVT